MSLFTVIGQKLYEGGMLFTIPILLMGITVLALFVWQLSKKMKNMELNSKSVELIMFLGGFSFIFGIFGQVLGFYQAAGAIQQAGEISPTLIWGGFKVSLIAPIMGFFVFLISGIMWFTSTFISFLSAWEDQDFPLK